jgi:TolB-like protein
MSFFAELKQRKVFRVAAAYLIVAWLALQVASIVLPSFDAPAWVMRVLILLVAIGFALALVLAWAVELSPDGVKFEATGSGSKRMAAVALVLLVLAFGWYFLGQPASRGSGATATKASAALAAPERSIAVLPFVNMSGDPHNEYFSDGLAETTLDMLTQVPDLKVIARTSSFAFKGKAQDMRQIGAQLGAAHLLEGSVQQAGDILRITVQLIKAADGTHLWSHHYDRPMVDLFKVQDEIASQVVQELAIALPAKQQQHLTQKRTENIAAYQEYLRGSALLPGRKVLEMREALAHFQKAITLDPDYARAYAAAGSTLLLLEDYSTVTPQEKEQRTRYIDRALQLDANLGEAHVARASMLESARDLDGAEQAYQRGIALAPGYATGYQWYGELLLNEIADVDRALPMLKRAQELDPLSPVVNAEYAYGLAVLGQQDQALAITATLIRDHPGFAMAYPLRRNIFESRGDLVGALQAQQALEATDPDSTRRKVGRCQTLSRFGAVAEARACLADLNRRFPEVDTRSAQTNLLQLQGDFAGALAAGLRDERLDFWNQAWLLLHNQRAGEALAILEKLVPELFARPIVAKSDYPGDAVVVGAALLQTGASDHGREVLRYALKTNAVHPYNQIDYGRRWWDVYALALLDELDQACDALQATVASGFFLDIAEIDVAPWLAPLRAKPCYEQALAPARAKAAAQVEAARKAGLLQASAG